MTPSNKQSVTSHEIKDNKNTTKEMSVQIGFRDGNSLYIGETGQKIERRSYQHHTDIKLRNRPKLLSCVHSNTIAIR